MFLRLALLGVFRLVLSPLSRARRRGPSPSRRPIIKPAATAPRPTRAGAGRRDIRIFNFDERRRRGRGRRRRRRQPGQPATGGRCVQLMPAIVHELIDGRANAARSEPFNCCLPAAAVPLAPRLSPPPSASLSPSIAPPGSSLFLLAQLIILYKAIVRRAQLTGGRNNAACMEPQRTAVKYRSEINPNVQRSQSKPHTRARADFIGEVSGKVKNKK